MKKVWYLTVISVVFAFASNASASFIETSASCPSGSGCEPTSNSEYSYTFRISDTVDPDIFDAKLTNTSPSGTGESGGDVLIDLLAFNMDALSTDFDIINVNPNWTFSTGSGGVQFDYVGERDMPDDRLGPSEMLTFQFDFVDGFMFPDDPFDLWRSTSTSTGTGIGGGTDSGQVAVSFQNLEGTEGSDLLASNWGPVQDNGGGIDPGQIPEPGILGLLGIGLLGMGLARRRRHIS